MASGKVPRLDPDDDQQRPAPVQSTEPRTDGGRPEPLAVGEIDAHVFSCPSCSRPLATGAPVCPGCGTSLIFGVGLDWPCRSSSSGCPSGRCSVAGSCTRLARPPAAIVDPGGDGNTPGGVVASPSPKPLTPREVGIPSKAVSALRQAAILDARLASQGAKLKTLMKNSNVKAIDIARILRTLNSDATFGIDLAPAIAPWTDAASCPTTWAVLPRGTRLVTGEPACIGVQRQGLPRRRQADGRRCWPSCPRWTRRRPPSWPTRGCRHCSRPAPTVPAVSAAP